MNGILAAIMTKFTGSTLSTAVGGRMYLDFAPDNAALPHIVFSIVSDVTDDNFTDQIDEFIIQFSLVSISEGITEISDMFDKLKSLYDYCALTISGYSHIGMIRQSGTTILDEATNTAGGGFIRHWAIEYLVRTEK